MRTFNPAKPIWCEGESASIGKVVILLPLCPDAVGSVFEPRDTLSGNV